MDYWRVTAALDTQCVPILSTLPATDSLWRGVILRRQQLLHRLPTRPAPPTTYWFRAPPTYSTGSSIQIRRCAPCGCAEAFSTASTHKSILFPFTVSCNFGLDRRRCFIIIKRIFLLFEGSSTPYQLRYHTNDKEASDGDQGNLGFCLQYQQSACPPSSNSQLKIVS